MKKFIAIVVPFVLAGAALTAQAQVRGIQTGIQSGVQNGTQGNQNNNNNNQNGGGTQVNNSQIMALQQNQMQASLINLIVHTTGLLPGGQTTWRYITYPSIPLTATANNQSQGNGSIGTAGGGTGARSY